MYLKVKLGVGFLVEGKKSNPDLKVLLVAFFSSKHEVLWSVATECTRGRHLEGHRKGNGGFVSCVSRLLRNHREAD